MTSILKQLVWESLRKRRKGRPSKLKLLGMKGRASVPQIAWISALGISIR